MTKYKISQKINNLIIKVNNVILTIQILMINKNMKNKLNKEEFETESVEHLLTVIGSFYEGGISQKDLT